MALSVFFVDADCTNIQLNAMGLLCEIFAQYPANRLHFVGELCDLLPKLPKLMQSSVKTPPSSSTAAQEQKDQACRPAYVLCQNLILKFIERLMEKHKEVGKEMARALTNDHKTFVTSFVEDLLTMLNCAEWPAAEVSLQVLVRDLHKLCGGEASVETAESHRSVALDLLGTIACSVHKEELNAAETPMLIGTFESIASNTLAKGVAGERKLSCVCGELKEAEGSMIMNCDQCQRWFHCDCIGETPRSDNVEWFCEDCVLISEVRRQLDDLRKDKTVRTKAANLDDILKQVVLNYLTDHAHGDTGMQSARRYFLAHTCDTLWHNPQLRELFIAQWELPARQIGVTVPMLNAADTFRATRQLAVTRSLTASFHTVIETIFELLKDKQPKIRQRALKAIGDIAETDPSILVSNFVHDTLTAYFHDQSISVRAAAMELVGKYMLRCPEVTEQYLDKIIERRLDKGQSVRNIVINLLKEIVVISTSSTVTVKCCQQLAPLVLDPEMSKQAIKVFLTLWFQTSSRSVEERLEQIVMVLNEDADDKPTQNLWLEKVIKEGLLEPKSKKEASVADICSRMCELLHEELLRQEEQKSDSRSQLLPLLRAVQVFARIRPEWVEGMTSVLQYYLKINDHTAMDECTCTQLVLYYFESVIPKLDVRRRELIACLESDLPILMRDGRSAQVIRGAAKCLCLLTEHVTQRHSKLRSNLDIFYKYLRKYEHTRALSPEVLPNILRSCIAIGHLNRYCNFDDPSHFETHYAGSLFSAGESVVLQCYKVLYSYYERRDAKDIAMRHQALTGMTGLFFRKPDLFLRSDRTVSECIDAATDGRLKRQMLNGIADYLRFEEEQQLREQEQVKAKGKATSKHQTVSADNISEAGIGVQLINRHLPKILALLNDENDDQSEEIGLNSFDLIHQVIRQGLALPNVCVPHLVEALAAENSVLRDKAYGILALIQDKYPQFLSLDGIVNGMEQAALKKELKGAEFSRVYELLPKNGKVKEQFISLLLNKLDVETKLRYELGEPENYFKRMSVLLAALPYEKQEEPLYALSKLDQLTGLQGENLIERLKVTREKVVKFGADKFDKADFTMCHQASCACVLLTLKQVLRAMYGIKEKQEDAFKEGQVSETKVRPAQEYSGIDWSKLNSVSIQCQEDVPVQLKTLHAQLKSLLRKNYDIAAQECIAQPKKGRKSVTPNKAPLKEQKGTKKAAPRSKSSTRTKRRLSLSKSKEGDTDEEASADDDDDDYDQ